MGKQAQTLKDFVVQNYIRPKVAFRLKPLLLRRDVRSLDLTPLEHRQLNRLLYGYDLSHRQLSHAIDVIKKVEDLHSFHYLAPGYGGRNRKITSYHLAKHILDEYNSQSADGEPSSGLSRAQVHTEARRRIVEREQEHVRSSLARPPAIRAETPHQLSPAASQLVRLPVQSLHANERFGNVRSQAA